MRLLDIFSRKFWKKEKNSVKQPQLLLGNSETKPIMKKFDIIVFSEDEGRQSQKPENGVCAQSAAQLRALYAATGERIQIIREYEDPASEKKPIEATPQNMTTNEVKSTEVQKPVPQTVPAPKVPAPQPAYATVHKKAPPKYFSICGTECKFEDDKIYQKQWVKILGNEASQYRLISDANNKEISLNGKHLEMLKWVLVQNESENSESSLNNSIMQILNG